jgi:hypothetical protein
VLSGGGRPSTQRDPRIDFFRGLSLYMVLVDHVPWDPVSRVTYRNLGFSDAACIFFFLSGISCGIAYSRALARSGWLGLMTAITKRTVRIYFCYLLCSVVIVLLSIAAADRITNLLGFWPSLLSMSKDPVHALRTTIALATPAPNFFILAMYILLTLVVIPLFLVGAKYSASLTLGLSGVIWIVCQFYPNFLFDYFNPTFTAYWMRWFNPIAWQFLFSIGMFIGIKYETPPQLLLTIHRSRWMLMAAWAIVIASFLCQYRSFSSSHLHLNLYWLQIPDRMVSKANLAVLPLLHFFSVALLVATYLKASNPIFRWTGARPFTAAGRNSLELYSLSAVLSVLVAIIVASENVSGVGKLGLDSIAIMVMAFTATASARLTAGTTSSSSKLSDDERRLLPT